MQKLEKMIEMNLFTKQKTDSQTLRINLWLPGQKVGGKG